MYEIIKRLRIQDQVEILFKYLEDNDPKMLLQVVKVMRRHNYLPRSEVFRRIDIDAVEIRHLPSKEMMRRIRAMMGEAHWAMFINYYQQYREHREDRTKIQLAMTEIPLPPPFPVLSSKLDEHVTSHIFGFLSDKDMYEASKVSRSFRDALIPRQKNVTLLDSRHLNPFDK